MANTLEIVIKATDKASKEIGSVAKGVHGLGGVASAAMKGIAIAGAAAVTAVGAVGAAIGKLAVDAIPLQGIEAAFEGITGAADETMDALRKGSLGMVTDRELMRNYNQAAQLVSKTFADQLPDAMKYLAKVSAATGQDMGYMLDSLTKGVGRMSPMILDNLGIQVSLEEATAEAAEMFGVEADALSKTQLQAGMMNVVMRALERNTAAMPEIAGTAAQRWAALGVTFKNVKDQIGLAMLPALEGMMTGVEGLVTRYLPPLVDWFERLGDKLGPAAEAFGRFITEISTEGYDKVESFKDLLWALLPTDLAKGAVGAVEWVQSLIDAIDQGDWETAGGMIWAGIEKGLKAASVAMGNLEESVRASLSKALGLSGYNDSGIGQATSTWGQIGRRIVTGIVTGMDNLGTRMVAAIEDYYEKSTASDDMFNRGVDLGRRLMGGVGSGITSDLYEFKGWPASWREIPALVGLAALFEQARDYYLGILAGLGGGASIDAQAITEAGQALNPPGTPGTGVWQQMTPEMWDIISGAIQKDQAAAQGATRGGSPLISSIGNMPQAIDLATVPDLVDDWTEAIVVEVQRRRRVAESEARQRADAPVRDVNITINAPSGSSADIEIGVLRGLRAAGVGIR